MKPKPRAVVFYVQEMLHNIITHHTAKQHMARECEKLY